MRFLVLTAAFGDGHNTAATNVSRALSNITEGMATCPVYDAVGQGNPHFAAALQAGYRVAITSFPKLWQFLYRQSEAMDFSCSKLELFNGVLDWIELKLRRYQPQAVISSWPLYACLVRRIDPNIPIYTIITDSVTVHRSWTTTQSTLHFVTDERSREVVEGLGIPSDTIRVTGFPVSLEFARDAVKPRTELKRLLWFPATGTRHSIETLRSLQASVPNDISFTIVLGRHARRLSNPLERELRRGGTGRPVQIVAWSSEVPRLMREHDFILTKAGGATTHESFASAIPMGINYVVPGQEEGNANLAIERGCAVRIERACDTGPIVRSLIDEGSYLRLAQSMARHSVNDGAFQIARAILESESARG